jgi:dsRNA-specific ribonuclease
MRIQDLLEYQYYSFSPNDLKKLASMYANGESLDVIAKEFNIQNRTQVQRHAEKLPNYAQLKAQRELTKTKNRFSQKDLEKMGEMYAAGDSLYLLSLEFNIKHNTQVLRFLKRLPNWPQVKQMHDEVISARKK